MSYEEVIHDRGRGPEIKGTRITVYTLLEYLLGAWSKGEIATMFQVTEEQVQAAVEYIQDHDLEVLRNYVAILERIRRGNPPELQAKLDARHEQFQDLVRQVKEAKARCAEEVRELIQKYRESPLPEVPAHAETHGG